MGTITQTTLTFEEFERLPDQPGKQELLDGELVDAPVAEYLHTLMAHRIFHRFRAALEEAHAAGHAYHLMGYKLPGNSYLRPDVSVTHAGQAVQKYLGGAPAIAVEIISPSNTAEETDLKTKLYFEFGAREVWLVYRKTRHVIVHVPGASREVGENETLTTPLLPGLALSVREILGE